MVTVQLRITNLDDINKDLKGLGRQLRQAIIRTLKEAAEDVKGAAIPLVRARSGKTRRSLETAIDIRRGALKAYVGTDWFVGRFLEKGTKKMRAYPFLRPALESRKSRIRMLLDSNINKAVIKAGTGI